MIIGIDLGTTNSLAAYFTQEGPRIIPNRLGKRLTPSVISMDEEEQIYVGDLAVERGLLYPGSAASVFKRDMGSGRKFNLLHKSFTAGGKIRTFLLTVSCSMHITKTILFSAPPKYVRFHFHKVSIPSCSGHRGASPLIQFNSDRTSPRGEICLLNGELHPKTWPPSTSYWQASLRF